MFDMEGLLVTTQSQTCGARWIEKVANKFNRLFRNGACLMDKNSCNISTDAQHKSQVPNLLCTRVNYLHYLRRRVLYMCT